MEVCSFGHDKIVYDSMYCPLCDEIEKHREEMKPKKVYYNADFYHDLMIDYYRHEFDLTKLIKEIGTEEVAKVLKYIKK